MGFFAKAWQEAEWALRDFAKNGLLASPLVVSKLRVRLLRVFDVHATHAKIGSGCHIGGGRLELGAGTFINYQAFLDPTAGIFIGRNVMIGSRSMLITTTHAIGPTEARRTDRGEGTSIRRPIHIGDNVWIGLGCTVLPGVTIGPGCVVAAGAVVIRDCEANGLYAGVPARLVRQLDP